MLNLDALKRTGIVPLRQANERVWPFIAARQVSRSFSASTVHVLHQPPYSLNMVLNSLHLFSSLQHLLTENMLSGARGVTTCPCHILPQFRKFSTISEGTPSNNYFRIKTGMHHILKLLPFHNCLNLNNLVPIRLGLTPPVTSQAIPQDLCWSQIFSHPIGEEIMRQLFF